MEATERREAPIGNSHSVAPHGSRNWKLKRTAQPGSAQRRETAAGSGSRPLHQRRARIAKPPSESPARNVTANAAVIAAATFERVLPPHGPLPLPPANVIAIVRNPPARAAVCPGAFVPPAGHGAWKVSRDAHVGHAAWGGRGRVRLQPTHTRSHHPAAARHPATSRSRSR